MPKEQNEDIYDLTDLIGESRAVESFCGIEQGQYNTLIKTAELVVWARCISIGLDVGEIKREEEDRYNVAMAGEAKYPHSVCSHPETFFGSLKKQALDESKKLTEDIGNGDRNAE